MVSVSSHYILYLCAEMLSTLTFIVSTPGTSQPFIYKISIEKKKKEELYTEGIA
jgi:hypothetical protein